MQTRRWFRRTAFLVPVLALAVWSCEHAERGGSDRLVGPQAEVVRAQGGEQYTLVEGQIPADVASLQLSQLIGVDGGSISLAGHTLTVPAGALDEPALFTVTLGTDGYVEVDLSAVRLNPIGKAKDIGKKGFKQPVTLTLTYAWASNVSDPGKLLILRLAGKAQSHNAAHEALPSTVNQAAKTVTVLLDHFSGYCMAEG